MKTLGNLFLLFIITSLLLPIKLYADNTGFTLGGEYEYNGKPVLKINVNTDGTWQIRRKVGSSYAQMFGITDVLVVKIDGAAYHTGPTGSHVASSDEGTRIIGQTEPVEQATKRYSLSNFYVDITFIYDKNDPDNIKITADIHAENMPSTTNISLHYAFDTNLSGSDRGSAVTIPDLMKNGSYLNGSDRIGDQIFTTAEVQSLSAVGCADRSGDGSALLFYTMGGRQFDRAYSAHYMTAVYYYANYTTPGVFNYEACTDNGMAVAYDNIPGAAVTTISTGLSFSKAFAGLNYTYSGLGYTFVNNADPSSPDRHITVAMGEPASLRLTVNNHGTATINDVGFNLNMPTSPPGLTINGTPSRTNLSTGSYNNGATYYQMYGGSITPAQSGVILASVSTANYGEWTIEQSNFSYLSKVALLDCDPTTLTVTTTVGYSSIAPVGVQAGASQTFTVKLPGELKADRNITVYLTYSGNTVSFSTRPTSVTIPINENSGTFTVTAAPTAAPGQKVTITLSSTSYDPIRVGTDKAVTLTVEEPPKVYYIPVNPHLRSMIVKQ
jgi:hypothetical protein